MKNFKSKILTVVCMVTASFILFTGNALAAEDLKLNPDVLRQIKAENESGLSLSIIVTAQNLFWGIDANGCTLTDIITSMEKYGYECKRASTKDSYGIKMHYLYFGTDIWWTEDLVESSFDLFTPLQKAITIYPSTEFEVSFLVERYDEIDDPPVSFTEVQALIDHISLINGSNNTSATQTIQPSYPSITNVYFYWAHNDIGWWVQGSDGSYLTNQWYYSPGTGYYYLGADGYMLTDTRTPDGYYVNSNGVWIPGI